MLRAIHVKREARRVVDGKRGGLDREREIVFALDDDSPGRDALAAKLFREKVLVEVEECADAVLGVGAIDEVFHDGDVRLIPLPLLRLHAGPIGFWR